MALFETIDAEIKKAMLAKQEGRLRGLRGIKSALLLAKTEKGSSAELNQEIEQKVLQKLAKQRRESADIYQQQNRSDLYNSEIEELQVIEEFLPKQLSEHELTIALKELIVELNITSDKEIGKLMGVATKKFSGKADGKIIQKVAKELLSI